VIKLDEDLEREDTRKSETVFLAVDMRDQSVQEVRMNHESWFYQSQYGAKDLYSLTKYKDNQIIKFGKINKGKLGMSLITIESFQRIFFY